MSYIHSKNSSAELIALFTNRLAYLSTMTTLLVGTHVATLFSPSKPAGK